MAGESRAAGAATSTRGKGDALCDTTDRGLIVIEPAPDGARTRSAA
jgi:hypothetical protein